MSTASGSEISSPAKRKLFNTLRRTDLRATSVLGSAPKPAATCHAAEIDPKSTPSAGVISWISQNYLWVIIVVILVIGVGIFAYTRWSAIRELGVVQAVQLPAAQAKDEVKLAEQQEHPFTPPAAAPESPKIAKISSMIESAVKVPITPPA